MSTQARSDWWTSRFPWVRAWPHIVWASPSEDYVFRFQRQHLLLDSRSFRAFMKSFWSIELWDSDLNLLEYYGLIIPARKAYIRDLLPPGTSTQTPEGKIAECSTEVWKYVPHTPERRTRHKIPGERASRVVSDFKSFEFTRHPSMGTDDLGPHVRPTPWLVLERSAWRHVPGDSLGTWVKPSGMSVFVNPGLLRARHRWSRPTDLCYWHWLSRVREGMPVDPESNWFDRRTKKPKSGPRSDMELNLGLDASSAMDGNRDIERFYLVGWVDTRSSTFNRSYAAVGNGPGQDWYLAALIRALTSRMDLGLQVRLLHAQQTAGKSARGAAYAAIAKRSNQLRKIPELGVPRIHLPFYRDVLASLAFSALKKRGLSGARRYAMIAKSTGTTPDYARRIVTKGGQLLR